MPSKKYQRQQAITLWTHRGFNKELPAELIKKYHVKFYHIGAEEECEKTGKLHHHAYLYCRNQPTMTALRAITGDEDPYKEPVRNPKKYYNYCNKLATKTNGTDPVFSYGQLPQSGCRMNLIKMRDHFQDQKTITEGLLDDDIAPTILRHTRAAQLCRTYLIKPRDRTKPPTELHIYYGPPGTGKSKQAWDTAEAEGTVYSKPPGKWWDGYQQETSVIIDDFRGELSVRDLLLLADRNPLKVPVKGGFEQFNSRKIYLTSNGPPADWLDPEDPLYAQNIRAIRRRCEEAGCILSFTKLGTMPG